MGGVNCICANGSKENSTSSAECEEGVDTTKNTDEVNLPYTRLPLQKDDPKGTSASSSKPETNGDARNAGTAVGETELEVRITRKSVWEIDDDTRQRIREDEIASQKLFVQKLLRSTDNYLRWTQVPAKVAESWCAASTFHAATGQLEIKTLGMQVNNCNCLEIAGIQKIWVYGDSQKGAEAPSEHIRILQILQSVEDDPILRGLVVLDGLPGNSGNRRPEDVVSGTYYVIAVCTNGRVSGSKRPSQESLKGTARYGENQTTFPTQL
eukprot:gnl/TRDRNA2_/TRDRNA2_90846_c0_seq1.p1 gnl/TRDRNA2_/TRDRNA2_90846_c0~~gnl/TRDRNA2_/TRDRNA2_90846_c0_seq1.p1  ORF type:complete len:267 (+),score=44.58 gnl/TRDRNA2_/TRDRNA2_90846_c0_seq1:67-867(+)